MNYRHVYCVIISHAKSEEKLGLRKKGNGEYYERHHILPISLFPLWEKRKSNLVLLTAREHFFCHQLLSKIYPNSNMMLALWRLANDGHHNYIVKNSKEYEKLRIKVSEKLSKLYKGKSKNKGLWNSFSEEKKKEIKQKVRKSKELNGTLPIGEKNGMFGKKWSDHPEWKRRDISGKNNPNFNNHKLAGENNPMYGKRLKDFMSEESYENMIKKRSEALKGKNCKKVLCIEENKIIKSLEEASKYYQIPEATLCRIIKSGKSCKTRPNLHFKYIC